MSWFRTKERTGGVPLYEPTQRTLGDVGTGPGLWGSTTLIDIVDGSGSAAARTRSAMEQCFSVVLPIAV
jgi:hypothetical protein